MSALDERSVINLELVETGDTEFSSTDRGKFRLTTLNHDKQTNNSQGKSVRKKQLLKFLLLKLFSLASLVSQSQQALLTNIYGKKLSELKGDLSHSFLLIPNSPINEQQNFAAQKLGPHTNKWEGFEGKPDNTSDQSNGPLPSPLALAWKQQNLAGQQQPQRSLRLMLQNGSITTEHSQHKMSLGEPQFVEGVSTDFPNPNINNLGHEITKILRKFFLHGYDKRVRPNYSGPPALVNVSFHIIGISSVDEVQMDFTTDFYFRQKWFDPRLEFEPVGEIDELCVGAEFAEKIWLPDTFFANEKTATFHKATTENTFIRIGNNGRVYRSIRLTVTCSCPMDLQYFPMDRQRCKIEIESYGYNTRDIDYRWERGDASVTLNTKIELPQFKILGFKMGQEIQNLSSGDYIRLYCEIHFVRSMGYYLFQIYIPASLIVMISWVSFWLHRNATPARVALGVTTVLTMTTLMSSTNAALPKISYIKSIDVFLGTCFVMVFASLLEYASVGYIGKRIAMKRKYQMDLKQMQQHHQKVCVAAAASAAAAAAAARQANPVGVAKNLNPKGGGSVAAAAASAKQLLVLQDQSQSRAGAPTSKTTAHHNNDNNEDHHHHHHQRPILMRRLTEVANELLGGPNGPSGPDDARLAPPPALAPLVLASAPNQILSHKPPTNGAQHNNSNNNNNNNNNHHHHHHQQQPPPQEPADPSAVVISKAAAEQSGEANVRICGLTPSDIDKYSRVVFPICFVCFNLMYWIIYGHISQQIDDHGPPLIPFVRS